MSARDKLPPAPPVPPRSLHTPFTWFGPAVKVDAHAMFVSRTNNVLRGLTVIMEIIHSNSVDVDTDSNTLLSGRELEDLTLMAIETTKMLHEQAGTEMVRINDHATGGAA